MDDQDFHKQISQLSPRTDGEELLRMLKTAGVKDMAIGAAKKGVEYVSKNKATTIGAVLGATAASALQYKASKPGEGGEASLQRRLAEKGLSSSSKSMKETKAKGKEPGYVADLNHARAKATVDFSKVQEKHPVRSALQAIPIGAGIGTGIGWAIKNLVK